MPQISTADFKNGMTLHLRDGLFTLLEFQHVNPGKGAAFVRTKIKNLRNGSVFERTFRAGERMERAIIDQREMQFLYSDGDTYVFMDNATYEQVEVPQELLGETRSYLVPAMVVRLRFYGSEVVGVEIPAAVELAIAETEPGVQGDRVSGATKTAVLETGKAIKVPLFVNTGDRIRVDTRTGAYITRA